MIPVYLILLKGGLLNTLAGVVLPFSVNAMGIFLMREQFREIPVELDEAARMDGASSFMIWRRILLPLSRPALATLGVFTFVGSWSGFLWPLVVLRDQELYTLPVGLNALLSGFSSDYRLLAAGAVIATIPVILLFLALQRFFIRGIQTSGLK
jgi:putative chitobiose transport system permease protein